MSPDLKESLPREILEELMQEGAQAFGKVLEKLLNLAMELERSEKALKLVSDDHVGMRAARRAVFPALPWQRCQFHMARRKHRGRLYRLSVCSIEPSQDPDGQRTGTGQPERRTRVVGIFPNQASVLRLTSTVLAEIHEEWITGRQYLNLNDWRVTEKPDSQTNYRKSVA